MSVLVRILAGSFSPRTEPKKKPEMNTACVEPVYRRLAQPQEPVRLLQREDVDEKRAKNCVEVYCAVLYKKARYSVVSLSGATNK